jgi:hypothetical protein
MMYHVEREIDQPVVCVDGAGKVRGALARTGRQEPRPRERKRSIDLAALRDLVKDYDRGS